jgi:endonuclease YncB( thermonuclease family)
MDPHLSAGAMAIDGRFWRSVWGEAAGASRERGKTRGGASMSFLTRSIAAGVLLLLLIGGAWAVAAWLRPVPDHDLYSVVDGDTLELQRQHCFLASLGIGCLRQRLRLYGVDAFESKQTCRNPRGETWPCGAVATERLRQLVAAPDFACHVDREYVDRHAREFAFCLSRGRDVGALLVSEGLAFAYGRGTQYLTYETEAREERRGAWAGGFASFVRPQFFRQGAGD